MSYRLMWFARVFVSCACIFTHAFRELCHTLKVVQSASRARRFTLGLEITGLANGVLTWLLTPSFNDHVVTKKTVKTKTLKEKFQA